MTKVTPTEILEVVINKWLWLCRDNIPTQLVASWPLSCTMFDGDSLAGPVPTLFAEDTEEALEAISTDPVKAHYDISKIHRIFFMPEHVDMDAALAAVKKPR